MICWSIRDGTTIDTCPILKCSLRYYEPAAEPTRERLLFVQRPMSLVFFRALCVAHGCVSMLVIKMDASKLRRRSPLL